MTTDEEIAAVLAQPGMLALFKELQTTLEAQTKVIQGVSPEERRLRKALRRIKWIARATAKAVDF
mgnify:FL=1